MKRKNDLSNLEERAEKVVAYYESLGHKVPASEYQRILEDMHDEDRGHPCVVELDSDFFQMFQTPDIME